MNLLMVLTSHGRQLQGEAACGLRLDEFLASYYLFQAAGIEVVLASPQGGPPPLDPMSGQGSDLALTARFRGDPAARDLLADTLTLSEIVAEDFAGAVYPGGTGALTDLPSDPTSQALIAAFVAARKPLGFISHAPAALLGIKGEDGAPFVAGRRLTALADHDPGPRAPAYSVEQALKRLGADYSRAEAGREHVVCDDLLVTGQNTASAAGVARRVLALLG